MSKFRDFFEAGPPAAYTRPIDWKPSASMGYTLGGDPGLGQLGKPPVGGWSSLQHYAQWKGNQMKQQRIFNLVELAEAMGVKTDKAEAFVQKYSSQFGQPLSFYAAETYLRDLKQRTDSARMVLADEGTTPSDPDMSARLKDAHFEGQGPTDNGNEPYVNQDMIQDLDKRLYTGEVSGRGGGVGAFELGTSLYCCTPSGDRPGGVKGRYDIHIPLIEKAVHEFGKKESGFTRKLAYGVAGAGALGAMGHKMLQPSTGTQLGHNTDAFAPGASAF